MEKFLDIIAFVVLVVLPVTVVTCLWLSLAKSAITVFGTM